jgi:nucleotide-binding universal stress UspA family protein
MSENKGKPEAVATDENKTTVTPEAAAETAEKGDVVKKSKSSKGAGVKLAEDKSQLAGLIKATRKRAGGKVILVPVDFSAPSRDALLFAAELAGMTSATMMVLHVVHDPGEMPGYYTKLVKKKRVERIQDIAKEVFDEFMRDIIKEHPKLKSLKHAENLMVIGLPVTRILQVAEKVEPFMVVMGSQGRTGLKHLFLGSKAEQVVQLCPVPVTIVKQKK